MKDINYLLKINLRERLKGINILSIIPLMIYLFIISEGFNLLLRMLLPESCYWFSFRREGACPAIFKFIQDFSFIFAIFSIIIIFFLIGRFLKYKKIQIYDGLLFINIFIIFSIFSYLIFSSIRLYILNNNCYTIAGGLGFAGYSCGMDYYLLNFHSGKIFLLIWFTIFIAYVSIFFKKFFPGNKNIFISRYIIMNFFITMIIPGALMILTILLSSIDYGNLSFKEVIQSGLTNLIF